MNVRLTLLVVANWEKYQIIVKYLVSPESRLTWRLSLTYVVWCKVSLCEFWNYVLGSLKFYSLDALNHLMWVNSDLPLNAESYVVHLLLSPWPMTNIYMSETILDHLAAHWLTSWPHTGMSPAKSKPSSSAGKNCSVNPYDHYLNELLLF